MKTNLKTDVPKQRCVPCKRNFQHIRTGKFRYLYECLKCGARLSVPIEIK